MQRALMPDGPREQTSKSARRQWMETAKRILATFGAPVQLVNDRSVASAIEQIRALHNSSEGAGSAFWFEGELVELDVLGPGVDRHSIRSPELTLRSMFICALYSRGWTLEKIGRAFGISRGRVSELRRHYIGWSRWRAEHPGSTPL